MCGNRVDSSEADAALQGLLGELSPGGIAALTTKLVTLGNADCQLPFDGELQSHAFIGTCYKPDCLHIGDMCYPHFDE